MSEIDTFLRWAGGKNWFIPILRSLIGKTPINHYHEPFLGGASCYFALEHKKESYLSDSNEELINVYVQVRDNPYELIEKLHVFPNTENDYYRIRQTVFDTDIERAAQFIYLNQTSFNGLYRVNRSGLYNVPYGFRRNWTYNEERIIVCSKKLSNARISRGDFEINKTHIKENDLVFLDPPYTVSHNNNGFIEYNKNLFSLEDQIRLSKYIDYIKNRKAYYVLTNADHESIREIFDKGDTIQVCTRNSLIGGKAAERKRITELVFTNLPQTEDEEDE